MKEDNLGFPAAIMVVAFTYTILWGLYQFAYRNGYEANKCQRKHGYDYGKVSWFNGARK